MTTVVEALEAATLEMHNAALAMGTIRTDIATALAAKQDAAQATISAFLRAGARNYLVDPAVGDDTANGQTPATALKTLDAALDKIEADGTSVFGANVFLLGDVTLRKIRNVYSPAALIGAEWGGGALGAPYHNVQRTLTVLAEANNSPFSPVGRSVPGFLCLSQLLRLQYLTVGLPDILPTLDQKTVFTMINGGIVTADSLTVTAATSTTTVSLLSSGPPMEVSFSGSIGSNAAGKIFRGVAAGQNPNSNFAYRTNLISA